ncbi:hypothetical protein L596_020527 [Steinernema carpocapsae]|uniref:Uncharacterized protein n=1 Tax=Steinernema carpocapsae TaxID=34508 RepID=A0A4U5MTT1_STECR|nr:hypothetical protein L596_020527 [Steinernema carpocapsae]
MFSIPKQMILVNTIYENGQKTKNASNVTTGQSPRVNNLWQLTDGWTNERYDEEELDFDPPQQFGGSDDELFSDM